MVTTQVTDRAMMRGLQLEKLQDLLGALRSDNAFYVTKLEAAGLGGDVESLDQFFERMPLTTKQELVEDQQALPPYGTNLTYPIEQYSRYFQTSGTTREPMRWLDTDASWQWMLDCWDHVYDAAEVTAADKVMFAFSFGPFLGFWTAYECAARRGCLVLPGGGMSTGARLRMMKATGATVLCCTPTYAIRLAEVGREEGIDTVELGVRRIIVAGEPGGSIPATRQRMQQAWGEARIVDHHGMTEVGPVTYECPKRQGVLHVIETEYIAEVVDPSTGKHVEAGAEGELVVTNLGRIGSPLLRYRTGDRVKQSSEEVCACGRHEMALEGGILGRADDMVIVRGVNVFPSGIEDVVRGFDEIAEFRVEIAEERSMAELAVLIEPRASVERQGELAQRLQHALRESYNLRIPVRIVAPGALPRFEMKAKRWVKVEGKPGKGKAGER